MVEIWIDISIFYTESNFFKFWEKQMLKVSFRLLILLLFLGVLNPVFASYRSVAKVVNHSPYFFRLLGGWHITEGNKIFEDRGIIGTTTLSGARYWMLLLELSFNNNLSEAEAVYEYFDDNFVKRGECYFQFHTRDFVWEPSFRESRCIGPVSLTTRHFGGGGDIDTYLYALD
ncbi:MAG: hypothetical protein A3I12_01805 [Gammaproteobacteria bacterium RIFCSPLOWO2_02_FULL_38_11]|nr:MAG: hypothetical protein A3B69_03305 [Gammaproteobacteria bacterium RIFCSPHIGHO2_02_FULL_38_33]OGT67807.1 MAG: hypothetical protein A3I12_01805 [Gammaproteobacteria bacterium RIFCSPLOWO2_02_FULL_38_11]